MGLFSAFFVAGWHVVWWGLVSPELPGASSLPTRVRSAVQVLDTAFITSSDRRFSVGSLRSPTTFSLPGGPGFSSFLVRDRAGLSPHLKPENLAFPLDLQIDASVTPVAVPRKFSPLAKEWLNIPPANPPVPAMPSPAVPASSVRVASQGFALEDLEDPNWDEMASWSTNRYWRVQADVEFDQGRVLAVFLEPQSEGMASGVPIQVRSFLMRLQLKPEARASHGRLNIQVHKSKPNPSAPEDRP